MFAKLNFSRAAFWVVVLACSWSCSEPMLNCKLNPNIVDLDSDASPIHDPTMIKQDGVYYVYSSSDLGAFYRSTDMRGWTYSGNLFTEIPKWLLEQVPVADHIGAPDVSFYRGRYLMFYQSHKPNTCNAATGLATNVTLDPNDENYRWEDRGLVLRSSPFYEDVEIYCGNEDATFNAIDAHFYEDKDGTPWLVFGSTIGGIKLIQLDPETLKPIADAPFHTLAQRFLLLDDPIIEAPYISYHDDYYYLFLSFNHCCLAENTQYQVRVGRSKTITGPYYDKDGWPLYLGGGSLVINGDGKFVGTGHADVWHEAGEHWLVHHAKDPTDNYKAYLNIRKLGWAEDGWPSLCSPSST